MYNALKQCQNDGVTIDEVTLKDDGSWAIIFNDNRRVAGAFPEKLQYACDDAIRGGIKIYSLDWINPFTKRESVICAIAVEDTSAITTGNNLDCFENPTFFSNCYYSLNYKLGNADDMVYHPFF